MSTQEKLRDWNKLSKVQPEIKQQGNDRLRSDPCWVLLKDGSIKQAHYFLADCKGTFGFRGDIITHWAYQNIPPLLPKDFKPKKIEYSQFRK